MCASDVPSSLQPSDPYATLVYYDQCGWTGLNWQGTRRRRFRFADSHITGSYKDAGAPDTAEVVLADFATTEFAGTVCVSGEQYLCNEQLTPCYIRAGRELWISDGTSAGTIRVNDIEAGVSGSDPAYLTRLDASTLLFAATMSPFGRELWRTDGTRLGTKMVTDIRRGVGSANPTYLLNVNGECCGRCLWLSPDEWVCSHAPSCCSSFLLALRCLGSTLLSLRYSHASSPFCFSCSQEAFTSPPRMDSMAASCGCPTVSCWTTCQVRTQPHSPIALAVPP